MFLRFYLCKLVYRLSVISLAKNKKEENFVMFATVFLVTLPSFIHSCFLILLLMWYMIIIIFIILFRVHRDPLNPTFCRNRLWCVLYDKGRDENIIFTFFSFPLAPSLFPTRPLSLSFASDVPGAKFMPNYIPSGSLYSVCVYMYSVSEIR